MSTLAINFFFLPPIGRFTIADPQNWVSLSAFLVTAILSSRLSDRARDEANEAKSQRIEMERLYDFSRQLLTTDNILDLLNSIPRIITATFFTEGTALLVNSRSSVYHSGRSSEEISDEMLRAASRERDIQRNEEKQVCLVPLMMGVRPIGALGILGKCPSRQSLEALGSMVAIAVERAGAVEQLGKTEAARESERIRSALLDSVTHELRTPLTSIMGAVSSLRSELQLTGEQRNELLTIIDEESGRLNRLIEEAVEMAQLDAHEVQLDLQLHPVQELVDQSVKNAQEIVAAHPITVRLAAGYASRAIRSAHDRKSAASSAGKCREIFACRQSDLYQCGRNKRSVGGERRRPRSGNRNAGKEFYLRQVLPGYRATLPGSRNGNGVGDREGNRRGPWWHDQRDQPGRSWFCVFLRTAAAASAFSVPRTSIERGTDESECQGVRVLPFSIAGSVYTR